jgi:hypothetical protein
MSPVRLTTRERRDCSSINCSAVSSGAVLGSAGDDGSPAKEPGASEADPNDQTIDILAGSRI